jgi:glycolate oxidase FAD binding subunit
MSDVATELRTRFGDDLLLPAAAAAAFAAPRDGTGLSPVAAPTSPDQLAELMALCAERGWRVRPAGAGTWPATGHPADGLVVTTQRMTGIVEHEPEDLVVGVRAGTSLEELQARLGDSRQFLPLDPPALTGATIGATVALRCAGPLRAGYGTPRDLVLGLELVTGDGRVLRFGGRVVKNVAGYDGVRLLTGSRGRLGIITAVFVRVRSLPRMDRTLAVPADSAIHAADLAIASRNTAQCEALEILSPEASRAAGLADRWHVLARLHGSTDDVGERYHRLVAAAGCRHRHRATPPRHRRGAGSPASKPPPHARSN